MTNHMCAIWLHVLTAFLCEAPHKLCGSGNRLVGIGAPAIRLAKGLTRWKCNPLVSVDIHRYIMRTS